jgi:hypothetical protein
VTADEARLLVLLAGGAVFPAVDVVARGDRVLLRNAATVGKHAGVILPEEVPGYLARLAGFDLIEVAGEDPALAPKYERIATDELVSAATAGIRRSRLVRRTVRISAFGARFWAACDPAAAESRAVTPATTV